MEVRMANLGTEAAECDNCDVCANEKATGFDPLFRITQVQITAMS